MNKLQDAPVVAIGVLVLLVVITMAATGCASVNERKQLQLFDDQTNQYRKAIRWREYGIAASMRNLREGDVEPINTDALREVRVTRYQVVRREVSADKNEAAVIAVIDFYHERENSIRTITDHQIWWYDEDKKRWFLDGNLPAFF